MPSSQAMTEGPGERAERARRRRFSLIVAGLLIVGGMMGAVLTALGPRGPGMLPPGWAIAAAGLLIVAIPLGSWLFFRDIDEVELRANLEASAWGVNFYALVYPVWYILWKGGLVIEPIHEILFVATLIVLTAAYLWKKARP